MELEARRTLPVFIANLLRATLYGASLFAFATACLVLLNGFNSKQVGLGIVGFVVLYVVSSLMRFFANLHKDIHNLDELNKEFTDVKDFGRFQILFLLALWFGAFVVSLSLSYYNVTTYPTRYPDAESTLMTDYEMSNKAIVLTRSLPSFIAEDIYSAAQAVHDTEGLSDDDDKVQEAVAELREHSRKLKYQAFYAVVFTFVFGLTFTLSVRSKEYNAIKKGIKNGNINVS